MPSSDPSNRTSVNPNVAALLTWLVPGAGHFLLGHIRFAVAAFVVVQGLYVAGLALTGGAFLDLLAPEIRGPFAGALTPEAGNVGAFFLHVRQIDFSDLAPAPFGPSLYLGLALTSTSGILNLILASRAHFDARAQAGSVIEGAAIHPATAVLFGWLIPGAGHVSQGRIARGLFSFLLITGMFVLGCLLAEGTNLDRTRHFYYWAGQTLLGPDGPLWLSSSPGTRSWRCGRGTPMLESCSPRSRVCSTSCSCLTSTASAIQSSSDAPSLPR